MGRVGRRHFESLRLQPVRTVVSPFDAWVKNSNPSQRWGKPEELVGTAVYLSSPASSYVNGQIIYVDGGWLAVL